MSALNAMHPKPAAGPEAAAARAIALALAAILGASVRHLWNRLRR